MPFRHLAFLAVLVGLCPLALPSQQKQAVATAQEARQFLDNAEKELNELSIKANQAQWVADNFITDDTEALSADVTKNLNVAVQRLAIAAKRFDALTLPSDLRRKFTLLKLALSAPPPGNPAEATELSKIAAGLQGDYGKGTYCRPARKAAAPAAGARAGQECLQINDLSRILATSRDPAELSDVWKGWHAVGAPMRQRYTRFVELSNKGARELGFADAGALWRSNYDMTPAQFASELDRLWNQVRPLYLALHTYTRTRLVDQYGDRLVPPEGLIPAHLLGNMWAQDWSNVYSLLAPKNTPGPGYDVGELLKAKKVEAPEMFRAGERFFTSLGMPKLPETFWERSLFAKPRDREVVCHASAWVIDNRNDVRIKMCAEQTAEDFSTIHHEEGHDYYFLAYQNQPWLFMNGANDGFHEAIGDAIALSITPDYLKTIGLLGQVPGPAADTMLLLQKALEKVAFLPFGLLVDQWRWKVFSGEIKPNEYNKSWWDLRARYQGVAPPMPRSEADFDAGAKYHVAANVPYSRYFLAAILQFQFYRALCKEAGWTGPLYRCSFYDNKKAGAKLWQMLSLGASKPWPDALQALTGQREMDATAILDYFAPLKQWLDTQNKGKKVGWSADR
jgi:peptidyl-dipeptidase A